MTTGWPQDEQDLRWPYSENSGTGPAAQADGHDDSDQTRGSGRPDIIAAEHGKEHPSGPLPVGPMPPGGGPRGRDPQPQRGRFGRGKSRDGDREGTAPEDGLAGDADYDWIKYLGEAGPAQETRRRGPGGAGSSPQDRTSPSSSAGPLTPAPPDRASSGRPATRPVNPNWDDAGDDLRTGRGRRGASRQGSAQGRLAPPDRRGEPDPSEPDTDARPSQSWPTFAPPAPAVRPDDARPDDGSRGRRLPGAGSRSSAVPDRPFPDTSAFSGTAGFSGPGTVPDPARPGWVSRESDVEPSRRPADSDRADFGRTDVRRADSYAPVRDRTTGEYDRPGLSEAGRTGRAGRDELRPDSTRRGSRPSAPEAESQGRRFGRRRGAA
jgi:hypothetical protein